MNYCTRKINSIAAAGTTATPRPQQHDAAPHRSQVRTQRNHLRVLQNSSLHRQQGRRRVRDEGGGDTSQETRLDVRNDRAPVVSNHDRQQFEPWVKGGDEGRRPGWGACEKKHPNRMFWRPAILSRSSAGRLFIGPRSHRLKPRTRMPAGCLPAGTEGGDVMMSVM